MRKEIVLPPHLYDRIKASAGGHGGIGFGVLFANGMPLCAHGHAWGTLRRYVHSGGLFSICETPEPELARHITMTENDVAVAPLRSRIVGALLRRDPEEHRISFQRWCRRLNVKRGVEVSAQPEVESGHLVLTEVTA